MSEKLSSFGVTNGSDPRFYWEIRGVFVRHRGARDALDFQLCDKLHIMVRAVLPPGMMNAQEVRRQLAGPSYWSLYSAAS
jgi:hypothetical protein